MVEKINNRMIDWLISEGCIGEEDREVYQYGIQSIVERVAAFLAMVIIMVLMDSIVTGIVFIVCFKQLRRYAGGYHAATYLRCFVFSNIAFISVIAFIKYDIFSIMIYRILSILSFGILYYLRPVESPNKTFTDKAKLIFYRKEKITICIMILLCIIMGIWNLLIIEKAIESAALLNGATSLWEVYRRKCDGNIHMR